MAPQHRRNFCINPLLSILAVGPFLYFTLTRYINLDFWYDELTTFLLYACVPLKKTVTDYSFPNNHIFLNILNNIYLSCIGLHDLQLLILHPWAIRLLMLMYALLFLFFLFLIGRKLYGTRTGILCVAVAATSIPFYNFATQVRGYVLSMALLAAGLYFAIDYAQRQKTRSLVWMTLLFSLLLYTIPLNLYVLFAIGVYFTLVLLVAVLRKQADWKYSRNIVIGLCCSVGIASLLYAPVLGEVIHNRFVTSLGLFSLPILTDVTPTMFLFFLSNRFYLIVILALGLTLALWKKAYRSPFLLLFLTIYAIPFLASFVRGDNYIYRLYVNLVGVFSLLVVACFDAIFRIPKLQRYKTPVIALLILGMGGTFVMTVHRLERSWTTDIATGQRLLNTYSNWHQYFYDVRGIVDLTRQAEKGRDIPVNVMKKDVDELSMPWYLKRFGVAHSVCASDDALRFGPGGEALVITGFPDVVAARLEKTYPGLACRRLNADLRFHNLLECRLPGKGGTEK
ncbi:conserved hypothetical protein [Solidesulfovibrio fructosivorans JJ]]|uniref:Uncharacterized protein n=1 Tax=Solidesulfovibrio fructosivorans JJ] TaxID=596151 RepID=E1JYK8_SOLFR|nr:glycosyltransferase family 39 protein [Solidesulfovibrio fructosivorans]EFL50592.1 conserved hypothetical protein [Solidesulfovibrio fructosivorans JJ]]